MLEASISRKRLTPQGSGGILGFRMWRGFSLWGFASSLLVVSLAVPVARAQAPHADANAAEAPAAPEKAVKAGQKASVKVRAEESKDEEGVKTYKFGAVEVEGRLKAPQILYFLRRVRAEFRAGLLGHRSFMPELSDTRRSPALK
jgi:hypothetical protein